MSGNQLSSGLGGLTVRGLIELARVGSPLPPSPLLVEVALAATPPGGEKLEAVLSHMTVVQKAGGGGPAQPLLQPDTIVLPITKTGRNPFADMITLGRALNNDLIVNDVGVSKFHCYFRVLPREVRIHDAGSTNGSKVDGRPVGKEGLAISSLVRIELGPSRSFLFIGRDDVKDWAQSLAGLTPTPR